MIWNGVIISADKEESNRLITPSRVVYIDNIFTAEYGEKVNRLVTPVTVQECGGKKPSVMIDKAIWDTGAVMSCISEEIVRRENMQPVDNGVLVTLTGQKDIMYYYLDIRLSEKIILHNVKVAGISMADRDSAFVVGMDIISRGNFSVKNIKGKTEICFEYDE